ncbi:MAG TPA: N-acetyltransferase [Cytophagales bacterium]|nr:N-acetyltransferase [Cytophagales bacterium]HAA20643.1 N-acetyltransferase [Cytophagales bacterium]HAP61548.1 N-acetyltransferase [Cytophagales bacterium]
MTDYQIRPYQEQDIDQLIELCATHAAYEQSDYSEEGKREALQETLVSPQAELRCLVVAVGPELVGYATFVRQYSTWDAAYYLYMDCLFLKEAWRGYGIGKKLLDRIKQIATEEGYFQVQWQTPVTNSQAIKFYKREGAMAKDKVRFFLNTP